TLSGADRFDKGRLRRPFWCSALGFASDALVQSNGRPCPSIHLVEPELRPFLLPTEPAKLSDNETPLMKSTLEDTLLAAIRMIPDYPKPGILFRDITTLLG